MFVTNIVDSPAGARVSRGDGRGCWLSEL